MIPTKEEKGKNYTLITPKYKIGNALLSYAEGTKSEKNVKKLVRKLNKR